ncbi:MAG: chorismate synthase [Calditrichaeota bacterium]|nr:chorismate synthase [Calditrichota bacterium]MCB9368856.1 chorismate synthase [Calditrichota bacterium]
MIRFLTAGETHGPGLTGILDGMPAGLAITEAEIKIDLLRRQKGYGRGSRMKIEHDHAKILGGVRYGKTLGAPIALFIENRDWENWKEKMSIEDPGEGNRIDKLTNPRPGHADFAGSIKYHHDDIRNVIERSSARETAMRVALAAICRKFLSEFGIRVFSHVVKIGGVDAAPMRTDVSLEEYFAQVEASSVRCGDQVADKKMVDLIDDAVIKKDTLGGVFEVIVDGLPVGLGSFAQGDRRLDGILAQAMISIHAMKAVEFGMGFEVANVFGSQVHDQLYPQDKYVTRKTNNAGGTEGGMSNGERIVMRVAMKPLSSLMQPLDSVNLATGEPVEALRERSDVCAVPAAGVVGEAMAILALMNPFMEKFGGDSMSEIRAHFDATPESPWR